MLIDWNEIPHKTGMRPGSVRRAVAAERMSMVHVETSPDAEFDGALHSHDNEQLLIMISGTVTVRVGEDDFDLKAGDALFFPPGVPHGAIGVGPEGCTYYEIFSPPRFDQLPGYIGPSPLEWS